jgi:polygalacturonase
VRIATPATARNTDGIDPAGATDVTIADSWIADGDDGIAIKGGSRASAHITVQGDHLYGTHGISIGSETTAGVSYVLVADDTVSGTDPWGTPSASSAGIRIKSSPAAGGTVADIAYRDVCVDAVKAPIDLDPDYGTATGPTAPRFTGITVTGLSATGSPAGATSVLEGLDEAHPLGLALTAVAVDSPAVTLAHAEVAVAGARFGGAPLPPGGDDVRLVAGEDDGAVPTCAFPAFPRPGA